MATCRLFLTRLTHAIPNYMQIALRTEKENCPFRIYMHILYYFHLTNEVLIISVKELGIICIIEVK